MTSTQPIEVGNKVALVPGENVLYQAEFTPHPFLRHVKTKLVITDRRVIARRPLTWFLFFRKGFHQSSCPLEHVSQFSYGDRRYGARLVFGTLLCLTIVGLPIGIYLIMAARVIALSFHGTGGGHVLAEADPRELHLVESAARAIDAIFYVREQPTVAPIPAPAAPTLPAPPPLVTGAGSQLPSYGTPWSP